MGRTKVAGPEGWGLKAAGPEGWGLKAAGPEGLGLKKGCRARKPGT